MKAQRVLVAGVTEYLSQTHYNQLFTWMDQKSSIWSLRRFTSSIICGPVEFFLTAMAEDQIAPSYGTYRLEDFFKVKVIRNRL